MAYTGTFTAVGDTSSVLSLGRDDSATVTLANTGGHAWSVALEESVGGQAWTPLAIYTSDQAATVVTPSRQRAMQVRLRLTAVTGGDSIAFALAAAGTSVSVIKTARVRLTHAQILALPTTPIELVAAPGAGYLISPKEAEIVIQLDTDYTNVSVDAYAAIGILNSAGFLLSQVQLSGYIDQGTAPDVVYIFPGRYTRSDGYAGSRISADRDGAPLMLFGENYDSGTDTALGNFQGGSAGNSMLIELTYDIVAL